MPHPLFSLEGRVALVTGSSRGLGFAMAEGLAECGATVVLNGRNERTLAEGASKLNARGLRAEIAAFDVTNEAITRAAVDDIAGRHGRLDILIANAGMTIRKPLEEWTLAQWNEVIGADLTAAFLVTQQAVPHMKKNKYGRIIFTTSLTALRGRPGIHAYVAAKTGLVGMTRSLACELAEHGITVNGVLPGYFETALYEALLANKEFVQFVNDRTPTRRWGKPRELAGAAIYLAAEASSFVTGQQIVVDGGASAQM